jgi:hypothetical protein
MNLKLLRDTKKNLQIILDHLNERDSLCDLVDDKDPLEIKTIDNIANLCYDIHIRCEWLDENL